MLRSLLTFVALLIVAPLASAQSPTTAPTTQPVSGKLGTSVELFNGKDFTGWTWVGPEGSKLDQTWSIVDGAMHMTGKPTGYIRTEREYGPNYMLVVEQRHLARGGGGILFGITGEDKVWPKTMQVQGSVGSVGDLVNQGNFKWNVEQSRFRSSASDSRVLKIGPASEKPMGDWDTVVLIVDHGTVSVEVNGKLQNVAKEMPDLTGKIGFQAEGAAMEFRSARLIPIE